ncbi:hypothetical protein [Kribbella sp. NPDC055071]
MADADQTIEEARRSLVQLISQLMQSIERLSAEIERFGTEIERFRTALDQRAPGVGAAIRQYPVEQVPGRLDATSPGWELKSDQFVREIPPEHPVFADPQTRAAASSYFGQDQRLRAAIAARVGQQARQGMSNQYLATMPTPLRPDRSQPAQPQAAPPPRTGPVQPQPGQAQPGEVLPDQAQPAAARAGEPQPAESRPAQPQPVQAQADQAPRTGPAQPQTAQPQTSQPQTSRPQSAQPQSGQPQSERVQPAQAQAVQGQPEQGQGGVQGTVRVLEAPGPGAVTLNANMTRAAGRVVVVADPNCTQARITISTADRTGPSAEAVQESGRTVGQDRSLSVDVTGPSSGSSWQFQSSSGNTFSFEGVSHTGTGGVYVGNFGDLNISNGKMSRADGQPFPGPGVRTIDPPSPIEIRAVVPEGSSVYCETDSANIETRGKVDVVDARSAAGNVTVDQATEVRAESAAGNVSVRNAETVHAQSGAGSVRVGDASAVTASSGSGDVRVDAGETVRATSGSGDVEVGTANRVTARSGAGDVRVDQAGTATVESGAGEVSVGTATEVRANTGRGDIRIGQADTVVAKSDFGAVEVGSTKDATVRSRNGDVVITDLRGSASATSGVGDVSVHANEGGKVTAGSVTGEVRVTASDQAVASGLTVNAEGPPGRVHIPEGAHTATGTAAGAGERDRTGPGRAAPARTNQAAAPKPGTGQTGTARSQD